MQHGLGLYFPVSGRSMLWQTELKSLTIQHTAQHSCTQLDFQTCNDFKTGLMDIHVLPRMSTTMLKPWSFAWSLKSKENTFVNQRLIFKKTKYGITVYIYNIYCIYIYIYYIYIYIYIYTVYIYTVYIYIHIYIYCIYILYIYIYYIIYIYIYIY